MPKPDTNPMQSAHAALRCHAKAKSTGKRCNSPAVKGWTVCRMHGAGGGAPTGSGNGAWVHGGRSQSVEQNRRTLAALIKQVQKFANAI
jgi:hypothetical protein